MDRAAFGHSSVTGDASIPRSKLIFLSNVSYLAHGLRRAIEFAGLKPCATTDLERTWASGAKSECGARL